MPYLRQSTAQTIRFGPCLDKTDGVTEETALTLAQADMRLSKDGAAFAQKSAAGNATHDSDGWYSTSLSTTDTNTVGELILNVHQPANMLPVWLRWWVLEEAVYDLYFGAAATGKVTLAGVTHTGAVIPTVTTNTDMRGTDGVDTATMRGTDGVDIAAMRGTDGVDTAAMRGTDNAALASVLGALADAAAAGDPSATDTLMQYIKQLINILIGTAGIVTFPAEAAPANAVSLAEVIRAIHADVTGIAGAAMRGTDGVDPAAMRGTDGVDTAAMRGTDSGALASVCTEARLSELDAATPGKAANQIDEIRTDTGEIGAAGVGLTDLGGMSVGMKAEVNAEVVDVINIDATGEPGQEALPVAASLRGKIDRMYKAYRNKKTQNSTDWKLFNDAGTVVDSKATVSDAAGLATKEEIITGP